MRRLVFSSVLILGSFLVAGPLLAVQTAVWTHDQPKDFEEGDAQDLVVTSLGEVTLGRKIETLHELEDNGEIINALARAGDGKVYAGTGPKGLIYEIDGTEVSRFAVLPEGGTVLSLLFTQDGKLLAGCGGDEGAMIYLIDGTGKAHRFCTLPDATYIWAMARGFEGEIYAATGVEGQLYRISPDGKDVSVVTDLKPKNLLCLAIDASGMLYVGTDENGLIVRINPESGKPFVLYDAKEPEISELVIDSLGNLYAATADANRAKPGKIIADKPGGKPELEPSDEQANDDSDQAEPAPDDDDEGDNGDDEAPDDGDEDESPDEEAPDEAAADSAADKAEKNPDRIVGRRTIRVISTETGKPVATQPITIPIRASDTQPASEPMQTASLPTRRRPSARRVGRAVKGRSAGGPGNAIYRIDQDGFVTEVFRKPVMILDMAEQNDTIYAATGNEGRLYAIELNTDRTIELARLECEQATTLLRLPGGRLLVGTANAAMLVQVADAYAEKGTLISAPLDADQIVNWGRIWWSAKVPTGTSMTIATRSSNVEDEESEAWDDWSHEMDATSPQQIPSINARFLQYRVTLQTTVPDETPVLRKLQMARVQQNQAPLISSVMVLSARDAAKLPGAPSQIKAAAGMSGYGSSGSSMPAYNWVAQWKAADPNDDNLISSVYFRGVGNDRWIRMAKDVSEPFHIWDSRTMPDGKYEIRVLTSDEKQNPPGTAMTNARISDPFTVDNTAPEVVIASIEQQGKDRLLVHAKLTDAASRITDAAFVVDSGDEWQMLAADDDIFDSRQEAVTFSIDDLDPGEHRVALKVQDSQGNTRYASAAAMIE